MRLFVLFLLTGLVANAQDKEIVGALASAYQLTKDDRYVVQGLEAMEGLTTIDRTLLAKIKDWFSRYLQWLTTHPYGKDEMNAANNHGTCWKTIGSSTGKSGADPESSGTASLDLDKQDARRRFPGDYRAPIGSNKESG
jgi:hypothetical protein